MKPPAVSAQPKAKASARIEGLEKGDHVYARTDQGPIAVRVLAHGRDGFTGECDQKRRHQIPWDRYLGHRSRMLQGYRVVDQGADGSILEDQNGGRRYLAGELPAPPAAPPAQPEPSTDDPLLGGMDILKKAHAMPMPMIPDNARIVMLKAAAPVANRPGLQLQAKTDKGGHQTHRWVRSMKEQKKGEGAGSSDAVHGAPMKHGDVVQFRHGDVGGEGKIVASGKDGVTLQDREGQTHQVRHEHLVNPAGGQGAPDGQGEKAPPGGAGGGGDEGGGDGGDGTIPPDKFDAAAFAARFNDPKVTAEDILKEFPSDTAGKLAEVSARLAKVKPTDQEFKVNGEWTPQRAELHQKIILKILSPERVKAAIPADGEQPTFTILGGRGGSGKSWFNGQVYDPAKCIVLDADEIKHQLPEYEGWNAAQVHEESGEIFDRLTAIAQELGLNLVHDATMKTAKKAVALVKGFKEAGYRTEAHYMYLPPQEAARRAVGRFLGPTKRFVPPGIVLDNTTNEGSFDQVKGLVDSWSFRDNNVGKGEQPRLISESADGTERGKSRLPGQPAAQPGKLRQVSGSGVDAGNARSAEGEEKGLRKSLPGSGRVIFLKAQIPGGAAADLLETVNIPGHTRNGKYVAPYTARRHKHAAAAPAKRTIDEKLERLNERRDPDGIEPSPDIKHFYVSAVDGSKRYLVAGPYDTHDDAKGMVEHVRKHADRDPRAHFMSWGTAGTAEMMKTPLGKWALPA